MRLANTRRSEAGPQFRFRPAVLQAASGRVIIFQLSITVSIDFSIGAAEEPIAKCGKPGFFSSDQVSQFASSEFMHLFNRNRIAMSINGSSPCGDAVFEERLWKTIAYDAPSLHAYNSVADAEARLAR